MRILKELTILFLLFIASPSFAESVSIPYTANDLLERCSHENDFINENGVNQDNFVEEIRCQSYLIGFVDAAVVFSSSNKVSKDSLFWMFRERFLSHMKIHPEDKSKEASLVLKSLLING